MDIWVIVNGLFVIVRLFDSFGFLISLIPRIPSSLTHGSAGDVAELVAHVLILTSLFGYLSISYALPWILLSLSIAVFIWMWEERQSGGILLVVGSTVSLMPAISLFIPYISEIF